MSQKSDIVKQGYVKVKSKNLGKWSKRWLILRRQSSRGGPVRLEKYPDESSSMTASGRTVYDLTNVEYVNRMRDQSKHRIYVVFSGLTSLQFAADSDMEAQHWLEAIQQEISGKMNSDRNEMFEVYLMKGNHLNASGECLLQVTSDSINVLDIEDPRKTQITWQLQSVRRYSVERAMLVVEVGRASTTGAGVFVFDTRHCDLIYDNIDAATRALAASSRHPTQMTSSMSDRKAHHSSSTQTSEANNNSADSQQYSSPTKSHRDKQNTSSDTSTSSITNRHVTQSNDGHHSAYQYTSSTQYSTADVKTSTASNSVQTANEYDLAKGFDTSLNVDQTEQLYDRPKRNATVNSKNTVDNGPAVQSPVTTGKSSAVHTYETVKDDKEFDDAIHDMMHAVGLESMIVDRFELPDTL